LRLRLRTVLQALKISVRHVPACTWPSV